MCRWMLALMALAFITAGCGSPSPDGKHVIIDWVDFVKLNDVKYEAAHVAISDPSFVGEELGEVTFNVNDNISNTSYDVKNGDAAFLEEGTTVYGVKDMPGYAIVPDNTEINGYRVYRNTEGSTNDAPIHFKDLAKESVEKIEIYEASAGPRLLNTLSKEGDISELMALFHNGETEAYKPDTSAGDPDMYVIVLDYGKPIAYTNFLFHDGYEWYWHEQEMTILPSDVNTYVH